jgi:hypothetical protein
MQRTTYTYDDSGNRPKIAQAIGCGYPVNMIYDDGTARVLPKEQNADEPTVVETTPPEDPKN